jgi:hypothetical protein
MVLHWIQRFRLCCHVILIREYLFLTCEQVVEDTYSYREGYYNSLLNLPLILRISCIYSEFLLDYL